MTKYRFNPPLHPSLRHIVPNIGAKDNETQRRIAEEVYRSDLFVHGFQNMRLGRIVTSEMLSPIGRGDQAFKYGFRFLYNPSTVSGGLSVGTGFIPDPSSQIPVILQKGLESITFQLLLNRVPDVIGQAGRNSYGVTLDEDQWQMIQKYGTQYDLEFLYRCCNGTHNTTTRTHTGDIGILLPNPVELFIGPFRTRGAIASISATDKMFSNEMVPVLTEVNIKFARFFSMAGRVDVDPGADATTADKSSGDARGGSDETSLGEGGSGLLEAANIQQVLNMFPDILSRFGNLGGAVKDALAKGSTVVPPQPGTGTTPPADPNNPPPNPNNVPGGTPAVQQGNNLDAPLPGKNIVTGGWHYRSGSFHGAWDYGPGGVYGHAVHACREGTVVKVRHLTTSYGKHVVIKTGSIYHYYCHMSAIVGSIKEGQVIAAGTHIGNVGSTGNSTGPHLHYEERINDRYEGGRQHPQFAIAGPGSVDKSQL